MSSKPSSEIGARSRRRWIAPALLALSTGAAGACGGGAPPRELVDARTAYQQAQQSQAGELTPAELHDARVALNRAEKAAKADADSNEARALAYIAQRKAQLAAIDADTVALQQQAAETEQARAEAQAKAAAEAKGELELTREQLAERERQLQAERAARAQAEAQSAKAEQQFKEEIDRLGAAAQVRDEARGMVVTLPGTLMFASGDSELRPAARTRLNQVADALAEQQDKHILVEGHTDSTGGDELNMALSRNRAENVRKYLISRGVPEDRITARGVGPSRPIADNDTPEGRAENRRVEIIVQDAQQQQQEQQQSPMMEQPIEQPQPMEEPEPMEQPEPMEEPLIEEPIEQPPMEQPPIDPMQEEPMPTPME